MTSEKIAIVTAGGGGIGEGVCRELKNSGYRLTIMSRSESCEKLAEELGGIGVRGSVTDPGDLENVVSTTMKKFGRIDAVVNHCASTERGTTRDRR